MEERSAAAPGPVLGRSLDDPHMRVMRVYAAQCGYLRPRAAELGIGQGQPKILVYVAAHGSVSQREIADFFELDPAAVSRSLDALERAGLVATAPGRDRRSKAVTATERGLGTAHAWERVCDAEREVVLGGFTAEERELFMGLLARAHANLRAAGRGEKNLATDPASPKGGDR